MEVGHTPDHAHFLSALQNCAVVYSERSNPTASAAVRKLELEVPSELAAAQPSLTPLLCAGPALPRLLCWPHPPSVGVAR